MDNTFRIHRSLSLRIFILSAVWLDVYSWSWFEAQSLCQSKGSTIIATTNKRENFWTKYYQRSSQWIAALGCSSEINPKNASFKFDDSKIPSAGLCQELCLERIGSNRINWFALRKNECACFNDNPMNLQPNSDNCKYDCVKDVNERSDFVECGGHSGFSVFLSIGEQDKDLSNSSCLAVDCSMKLSTDVLCSFKDCLKQENISEENRVQDLCLKSPSFNEQKACDGINSQHPAKKMVVLKRQIYWSYDREGLNLTSFEKRHLVGSCQQCNQVKGCQFLDCNEKTGVIVCENGVVYSTQKPAVHVRKETFLLSPHVTGSEKHPNKFITTATNVISEIANTGVHSRQEHVTIKKTFHLSSHVTEFDKRSNKITTTAGHGISNIANNADGTIKKTFGIVASFLVSCLLLIAGIFYMCSRKKKLMKRERERTSASEGCRGKIRKIISGINDNQTKNSVSFLNMPKECLYELANNEKVQAETSSNEETDDFYHHLRDPIPKKNIKDDTYMVAGYKTSDEDNVYFGRMEELYDHLRGTDRTRHEDDTYDHAPNIGESTYSSCNINVGRKNSRSKIEGSLYDHLERQEGNIMQDAF